MSKEKKQIEAEEALNRKRKEKEDREIERELESQRKEILVSYIDQLAAFEKEETDQQEKDLEEYRKELQEKLDNEKKVSMHSLHLQNWLR